MRLIRDPLPRSGTTLAATLALVGAMVCILHASSTSSVGEFPLHPRSLLTAKARRLQPALSPREVNITVPAAVHGWVKKAGPLDPLHWHDDSSRERRAAWDEWFNAWRTASRQRAKESEGGQAAVVPGTNWLPEPPQAIFPPCQVFVNHRYKFIYLRQRKTGSMSLVNYLTQCDEPNPGPACMDILPSNTSHAELARLFSDYFVFTVVRNPFKRALSSYKFLLSRMRADTPQCTAPVSWDGFCTDPMTLGQRCRQRPECCVTSAGMFWAHTVEQGRCMMAEGGSGWAVDFIGRTERMEDDLEEILSEIDRRREPGAPALHNSGGASHGSEGEEGGEGGGHASGPSKLNVMPTCSPDGERLQPFSRTVDNVTYLAAVPQEQYCDDSEYFLGKHKGCMRTLRHFFRRDLELLWGEEGPGRSQLTVSQA